MCGLMKDNEHLILMDMQVRYEEPDIRLPAIDIRKLSDAGIKTAMMFCTNWGKIEPEKGKMDFTYYLDRVKLLQDNGMNVMIQCFTNLPPWIPDEWKVMTSTGATMDMISPWNIDAMAYVTRFYQEMVYRFNSKNSYVVNSWLMDGETLFPNEPCIYDPAAVAAFRNDYGRDPAYPMGAEEATFLEHYQIQLMGTLQSILRNNEYNDIWLAMHPALAGFTGNGCSSLQQILGNLKFKYPCANIHHLYCTWTQWDAYYPLMSKWRDDYDEQVFGGAEYAEGVVGNTYKALAAGIRGLLINPCHPFTGHTRVQDWMLGNISDACSIWQAAKGL